MRRNPHNPPPGKGRFGPNKATLRAAEIEAAQIKSNPFSILDDGARGELSCTVCRGLGRMRVREYTDKDGRTVGAHEKQCVSCHGTGRERVSPETRVRSAAELAEYCGAKRRAIEFSGEIQLKEVILVLQRRFQRAREDAQAVRPSVSAAER